MAPEFTIQVVIADTDEGAVASKTSEEIFVQSMSFMGDGHTAKCNKAGYISIGLIKIFCYYMESFRVSLISVSQLASEGYTTIFVDKDCVVRKK